MKNLNRNEAASYLGVSVRTLDRLAKNHKISYMQSMPGCKVTYTLKSLDSYLAKITVRAY